MSSAREEHKSRTTQDPEEFGDTQLVRDLLEVCHFAYLRGYLSATEGNLSIRVAENLILSTASNTCKGRISEAGLLFSDLDGNSVGAAKQGKKLSTELKMHLCAYRKRNDIKAIVHAHPTVAVGFTVAGKALTASILPEVVCTLGSIPTAPYATPSTDEIPSSIEELVLHYDAIMLDHHGALTLGEDIWSAFYKMETLEHYAQTLLVAELLGGAKALSGEQVNALLQIRSTYGLHRPIRLDGN